MKSFEISFIKLLLILIIVTSCSPENEVEPDNLDSSGLPDVGNESENIPAWIYEEMSFFYYWNEDLPDIGPVGDEDPELYFSDLLYPTDRFSYISNDAEALKEEITGTIIAMGFSPAFGIFTNSNNLFAIVEYVYPGSPAENAGLKRGDVILKINGQALSQSNFQNLLSESGFSVTLGNVTNRGIVETNEVIDISTGNIDLDPVIHYEVKNINNEKTGYLVFVDFIAGEDDKWLKSLGNALGEMKNEGISQFILDLRYNPGRFEQNENNLNLDRVIVLTSGTTASASELVINGLKPYMDVVVIGENTFGKFYGSYLLYDQNDPPKHNWAIAPVVLKYANANGVTDYTNGISPDIYLQDDLLKATSFGDEADQMLATAIAFLNGNITSGRIASSRNYTPVHDLKRINRKNIFNSVNVFMN